MQGRGNIRARRFTVALRPHLYPINGAGFYQGGTSAISAGFIGCGIDNLVDSLLPEFVPTSWGGTGFDSAITYIWLSDYERTDWTRKTARCKISWNCGTSAAAHYLTGLSKPESAIALHEQQTCGQALLKLSILLRLKNYEELIKSLRSRD